jgi:hypothetical protein
MNKYYRKRKRTLREKITLPIVLLGLLSSGAYADAGTLGKPVKINGRDILKAAVAVVLCKAETEVDDIVRIELVEVDGKMVYREYKVVADPVKTEKVKK